MSEHLRGVEGPAHHNAELDRIAAERLKSLEKTAERPVSRVEQMEAARESIKQAEQLPPQTEVAPVAPQTPFYQGVLTKAANYRHTMASLQHRMKPGARAFSEFIHNPTVDAVSEVAGKTVLRPSVSLGASTTAVLLTGFLYLNARRYGFELRGSEIWITLLAGGLIGLALEAGWKLLRAKRT